MFVHPPATYQTGRRTTYVGFRFGLGNSRNGRNYQGPSSAVVRQALAGSASSMPTIEELSGPDDALGVVEQFDFLVLGSGIAGLTYALKVAEHGRVAIVTKGYAEEGATKYAQGGVCAVLDRNDSVQSHIRDTMVAGAFLNDARSVEVVCREGPKAVLELAQFGAEFTRTEEGKLHLTREGGHSARRIVHAADATGAEIERALLAAVKAHNNILIFEHCQAVDIVVGEGSDGKSIALGADILMKKTNTMHRFIASVTMLATGGAGQVYPLTTNPNVATGDGIAMAHRAQASIANMEFVQFHPTAFFNPASQDKRAFLISEAVRGEGGVLMNLNGERFMNRYDSRGELAPRDIVARAIHFELEAGNSQHVLLDISHKSTSKILSHFPTISAHCASYGIDITKEPIPVVPAQHYMCGGVQSGLHGETNVPGLFVCGEVACSGLHGANRLASNSLLEGLVFGSRAVMASVIHAEYAQATEEDAFRTASLSVNFSGSLAPRRISSAAKAWVAAKRQDLTNRMWEAAGIVRKRSKMIKALKDISDMCLEARALSETYGISSEMIELRNLATTGEIILTSALLRKESRGGHFCLDFPETEPQQARATVILPSEQKLSTNIGSPKISKGFQDTFRSKKALKVGQSGFHSSQQRSGGQLRREISYIRSLEE